MPETEDNARQKAGHDVAALLSSRTDEAADAIVQAFCKEYPDSNSLSLDDATLRAWTNHELTTLQKTLDGHPIPHDGARTYAGDIDVNVSPLIQPIVTRMETWIFVSRTLSPFIWSAFANDLNHAQQALDALEWATIQLMRADVDSFLSNQLIPGALQREWSNVPLRRRRNRPSMEEESSAADRSSLTSRERDIVHLVAAGKTNGEISSILEIRQSTVKNHLSRIFDKANVNTRTELARWAFKNGLD